MNFFDPNTSKSMIKTNLCENKTVPGCAQMFCMFFVAEKF